VTSSGVDDYTYAGLRPTDPYLVRLRSRPKAGKGERVSPWTNHDLPLLVVAHADITDGLDEKEKPLFTEGFNNQPLVIHAMGSVSCDQARIEPLWTAARYLTWDQEWHTWEWRCRDIARFWKGKRTPWSKSTFHGIGALVDWTESFTAYDAYMKEHHPRHMTR
jgi:hypothetical protein